MRRKTKKQLVALLYELQRKARSHERFAKALPDGATRRGQKGVALGLMAAAETTRHWLTNMGLPVDTLFRELQNEVAALSRPPEVK